MKRFEFRAVNDNLSSDTRAVTYKLHKLASVKLKRSVSSEETCFKKVS
jgi:hypothetical protein